MLSSKQPEKSQGVHVSETPPESCPTCGAAFVGQFCHSCGEKRIAASDLSLRYYAQTLLADFTHLDSKLFRTIRLLLTRPSALSEAYVTGRRSRYIKPLQVFLLVNLVFFLVFSSNDAFAPRLAFVYDSDTNLWNGLPIKTWVDTYAANKGMSVDAAITQMDIEISNLTKGLLYLFVPFLGLVFWGLFYKQNRLLLCHIIFATHWFAFFILFMMVCGVAILVLIKVHGITLLLMLLAALLPFHLIATRHFYGGSWLSLMIKSILFLACFALAYILYLKLIMFIAYWVI
ncbi:MAG: DUF3667 domain-containing protein [Saprospiraceae bacterium]|nr:DUF3667 domain-containing protein [Saprospiraceae bacterium]